jgi:AsmA family
VKLFPSKRRGLVIAAVIVLLLFFLRPGAARLKSRIAGSIGSALGRTVEIGSIHIRLIRPGFDLRNVAVYDDPAFGAEPMLRAAEVTANLRLSSLLRGRMEISRLDLSEPSLNLVHGGNGRWNLEALLERAAQKPLAPTATKSEPRPRFPYIEATSGRINFKMGQEKKPYALINADFSLWQDSENAWGVRLKAQPFRSDLNLSDIGTVLVSGTWQRASKARETPVQFSLEWNRPQLGQLTKFITNSDQGWRGAVQLDATLSGTPEQLQVNADASIRDFRRYDVLSGKALRSTAHCDARYSSLDHMLHEVFCRGPVGDGMISVHGDMGLPGSHLYDLMATSEEVPASALVALAQCAKKHIPEDLSATGTVVGSLSMRGDGKRAWWMGSGEIARLHLASESNKVDLDAGSVPFVLNTEAPAGLRKKSRKRSAVSEITSGTNLEFGPFPMALGRSAPATVHGWVSRSGYTILLEGETEIGRTLGVARAFGLPTLTATADGVAQVDLQIAGSWAVWPSGGPIAFSQPQVTGTARLRNVRAELRGVETPVEISSAELLLLPDEVRLSRFNANAAHSQWAGSLNWSRGCGVPGACVVHFGLSTNEAGLSQIAHWVNPGSKKRPWYQVLTPSAKPGPSFLASLRAEGKVSVARLVVRDLDATQVSASVSLENGKLRVSDLRADFFGGKHRGEWQMDFSVKPPVYVGSGSFAGISLARLTDAMKDDWITGTAGGSYQLRTSGLSSADFWQSAQGTVNFAMRDGVLQHVSLDDGEGPLHVARFEGSAHLRDGGLEMEDGHLICADGVFQVSGTAALSRELDLKLAHAPEASAAPGAWHGYAITGTVGDPHVESVSAAETHAALKQ